MKQKYSLSSLIILIKKIVYDYNNKKAGTFTKWMSIPTFLLLIVIQLPHTNILGMWGATR